MKRVRRIVMLLALGALGLLTFLSVVGAFAGVDRARLLFNSLPLAVYWVALLLLLVSAFVFFKRLIRSPGLLAVHLGPLLIVGGAIAGSDQGHELARRHLGIDRVPSGFMQILEGATVSAVSDERGRTIGTLPFSIRLEDFWIEYYDDGEPWALTVELPAGPAGGEPRLARLDWAEGRSVPIPSTEASLEVLRFLPGARPSYPEGVSPTIVVTGPDGEDRPLQARAGERVELGEPPTTVEVVQLYGHLQVREGQVVDIPGSTANPAVKVRVVQPDGTSAFRYAFGRTPAMHQEGDGGLRLRYVMPRPIGVEPDPRSELPAMEIEVRAPGGRELRGWLAVTNVDRPAALSLAPVLGEAGAGRGPHDRLGGFVFLHRLRPVISDYKSRLVVVEGEREVAAKVIEVNDPLHHRGYHFYQHSYDSQRGAYTVLSVRSDLGLNAVWAGFVLCCLGMAMLFWVEPARRSGRGSGSRSERPELSARPTRKERDGVQGDG